MSVLYVLIKKIYNLFVNEEKRCWFVFDFYSHSYYNLKLTCDFIQLITNYVFTNFLSCSIEIDKRIGLFFLI